MFLFFLTSLVFASHACVPFFFPIILPSLTHHDVSGMTCYVYNYSYKDWIKLNLSNWLISFMKNLWWLLLTCSTKTIFLSLLFKVFNWPPLALPALFLRTFQMPPRIRISIGLRLSNMPNNDTLWPRSSNELVVRKHWSASVAL